jgi:tRNA uridine 5-carboxymethylaminomethyl modification enzyme
MVGSLLLEGGRVAGVRTENGFEYRARSVVLTAGTFLRGRIHVGRAEGVPAGRAGDPPSVRLAEQMEALGLEVARFKTGTPPRIDGRSVELGRLEAQASELADFGYRWSHFTDRAAVGAVPQLTCWVTHLEEAGKALIAEHLGESAMYGGAIGGRGPRYCPSVEDKVLRFPDAARHQLFLEPEGLETGELYVNGLSTSLPTPVQLAVLRTVRGLERAHMTRAGYAIEYDYYPPTQLDATLAVRALAGLWFAGQINGTTGYEEAAAQGVVAGLNAARWVQGRPPVVLGRETSYVAVLVDDLVTRGVDEPYRLFTSRSEFRLTVRQDNALRRLSGVAESLGLYSADERGVVQRRLDDEERAAALADRVSVRPEQAAPVLAAAGVVAGAVPTQAVRAAELARRPGVSLAALLAGANEADVLDPEALVSAELELKYAGYLVRERDAAARLARMGAFVLPSELPYAEFRSLTTEARQKLAALRPGSLAQAGRVPGVSPSDLQNLVIEVERWRRGAAPVAVSGGE